MSILASLILMAFVPLAWLLQTVVPDLALPGWLIGALPVLSFSLAELIVRIGGNLTGEQKRALYRGICLAIVGGLVVTGQTPMPFHLPALPSSPYDLDAVGAFIPAIALYASGTFLYIWGGGKTLHDLLDAVGFRA